jgi:hypothetical protein
MIEPNYRIPDIHIVYATNGCGINIIRWGRLFNWLCRFESGQDYKKLKNKSYGKGIVGKRLEYL